MHQRSAVDRLKQDLNDLERRLAVVAALSLDDDSREECGWQRDNVHHIKQLATEHQPPSTVAVLRLMVDNAANQAARLERLLGGGGPEDTAEA